MKLELGKSTWVFWLPRSDFGCHAQRSQKHGALDKRLSLGIQFCVIGVHAIDRLLLGSKVGLSLITINIKHFDSSPSFAPSRGRIDTVVM